MTRNDTLIVTKSRRWKIAEGTATNDVGFQATCQVFISIHMNSNAARDSIPRGTETYYAPKKVRAKSKLSYRADSSFAREVHPRLIANAAAAFLGCHSDRGIKTALHTVTKNPNVPSLLLEICFLTNRCQLENIVQGSKQAVIAEGIAAGVSFFITPGGSPQHPDTTGMRDAPSYVPEMEGTAGVWPASTANLLASSEGFEGGTFPPTGWTLTTLGAPVPHRWHRTTDPVFVASGVGGALVGGQSAGAIDEWLISPTAFVSASEHALRFTWAGNPLFASAANATCAVKPIGSSTWSTVWALLTEPLGKVWDFRQQTVDLTPWIGDSVQVAFRVTGMDGADFMIDDVSFGNYPPTTAPANDLCVNAIQLPAWQFSIVGSTCLATNDIAPPVASTCVADEFTGPDVFYRFNAVAGDTIDFSVTGDWYPVAYIVNACDSLGSSCLAATRGTSSRPPAVSTWWWTDLKAIAGTLPRMCSCAAQRRA